MSGFYLHESSYVDDGAKVGQGSKIWHFCHVMSGAIIGKRCILGQNVFVGSNVVIGDRVKIQNNVSVYEGVIVEDEAFLGPSMVFTNVINPRSHIERKDEYRTTWVGKGCTIGANATIVCGVSLGAYSFVGAGAVVTADVPEHAMVYGVPARIRGWVCQCGEKLDLPASGSGSSAVCPRCGERYQMTESGLTRNGVHA